MRDSRWARRASSAVSVEKFVRPDSASTIRRARESSPIEFVGFTIRSNFVSLRVQLTVESTQDTPSHKQDFLIRGLKSPGAGTLNRRFNIPQVSSTPRNDSDPSRLELSLERGVHFPPQTRPAISHGVAGLFDCHFVFRRDASCQIVAATVILNL